ncbi:MAG: hypothetical protein H7Y17_09470 [Chlorobia bacterium]|nr:hypothetical protein [Fimbriimonadaceae bacterium]
MTITGADGTKVTASSDGSTMTVTDDKGVTSTLNTDKSGNMTVKDGKGGEVEIGGGNVSEGDLGVAFYPGSTEVGMGTSKIEDAEKSFVTCVRTSKDEPSKVLEFYQSKVMNPSQASTGSGQMKSAQISGKLADGGEIAIAATKDGDKETQIMITVRRDKKK